MSCTYGFRGSLSVDHHKKHFAHLKLTFLYRNYVLYIKECWHCFNESNPWILLRWPWWPYALDRLFFQKQVRTRIQNSCSFLRVLWRSANHRRLLRCLPQPVKPNERENWSGVHNGQILVAAVWQLLMDLRRVLACQLPLDLTRALSRQQLTSNSWGSRFGRQLQDIRNGVQHYREKCG